MPLFAPSVGPAFNFKVDWNWPTDRIETVKGYEQVRPLGTRGLRSVQLVWPGVTRDVLDEILSFLHSLNGTVGPFTYVLPKPVSSPLGIAPTLTQVAGGSLGARTYSVQFSWYSNAATQETEVSKAATLAISANNLVKVTVPIFPQGSDRVRIYAVETPGTETLQTTNTTKTWTEPVGGLVSGAAKPSANTLKPAINFIISGPVQTSQLTPNRWQVVLPIQEQKIP